MERRVDEFLKLLGIPEDEKDFVLGLNGKLPQKYVELRDRFIQKGLKINVFKREELPLRFEPFKDWQEPQITEIIQKTERFFYVEFPENLKLKEPVPLCCFTETPFPQNQHVRVLWKENSEGVLVIGSTVPKLTAPEYNYSSLELLISKNVRANIVILNSFKKSVIARPFVRGIIKEGSEVNILPINLFNGKLHEANYRIKVLGNANLNLKVISFARDQNSVRDRYEVLVEGKNSEVYLGIKGISRDDSVQKHFAIIEAGPEAEGTKGIADTAGYLLHKTSSFEVLPALIVKNDSVFLDHEAYLGNIPEDLIEYLRSRGFSREDALYLVVHSLISPVKELLPARFQHEIEALAKLLVENRIPEL